jgi:hypothetical protein
VNSTVLDSKSANNTSEAQTSQSLNEWKTSTTTTTVNRYFSKSIKRELSNNSLNDNKSEEKKVKIHFVEED